MSEIIVKTKLVYLILKFIIQSLNLYKNSDIGRLKFYHF